MANDVEAHLPGSKSRTAKGTWGVDVRAGLIRQLMSKGVTAIEADQIGRASCRERVWSGGVDGALDKKSDGVAAQRLGNGAEMTVVTRCIERRMGRAQVQ